MLTAFGVAAVTFMMLMYALERRHRRFILAFAGGCALASTYGFLVGAWPFGVVEAIWALVALDRYRRSGIERETAAEARGGRRPAATAGERDPSERVTQAAASSAAATSSVSSSARRSAPSMR